MDLKLAVQDRNDFHKTLVNQIIELDKQGYNSPHIAEKVGFTYKYVHLILNGKSLKEYSGDYPNIYKARRIEDKKISKKVIEYTLAGIKVKEIAEQLDLSVDMVRYYPKKQGLNEKVVLERRNKRLVELFSTENAHSSLSEKLNWIVDQLKYEYPNITFSAVKTFYYSLKSDQ